MPLIVKSKCFMYSLEVECADTKANRFLYRMILCMDANFRLKNQLVSNYSQDPGLGIGWAFMVPRALYEGYVLSRASDEDVGCLFSCLHLALLNNFKGQYLCWIPGIGEGEHQVFKGSEVHGCWACLLRMI